MRSDASASSRSDPTKQLSVPASANSERDDTSSRANVRRSCPMTSRTNQCLRCSSRKASVASTRAAALRSTVDTDVDEAIVEAVRPGDSIEGRERNSAGGLWARARVRERPRALLNVLLEILRLDDCIDQRPVPRTLTAHAFDRRAKNVG